MKYFYFLAVISTLLLPGCAKRQTDTVFQVSTLDALAAGVYEGSFTYRKLLGHGDFGIGTFHDLDGEMTLIDGKIFQVKSDGKVYEPDPGIKTPFATVCYFNDDLQFRIDSISDSHRVEGLVNERAANQNLFCAIRIEGEFLSVRTRSVPRQMKPYPPLVEVAATQPEFTMENISGTIIGYRFPPFIKGMNFPGYHLHFISNDGTRGGHILSYTITSGICRLDIIHQFILNLPKDDASFAGTDLSRDRSEELRKAEGPGANEKTNTYNQ